MFKRSFSRWGMLIPILFFVFWAIIPESQALESENFLDRMVDLYHSRTQGWEASLRGFALRVFWLLAGIEFTWSAIRLALRGADLNEFLAELVNRVMYIGFFLALLMYSSDWASAIVNSFRSAGSAASISAGGVGGISPSNVLDAGMEILKQITAQISVLEPGDSIILALAAIVILVGFALISSLLVIALVESYFVISAGVILMGFGGSRWTSDFAINTLKYAVSVGAKLFMVQLVIGLGQQLINEWAAETQASNMDLDDVLMIAAACIVFTAITKVIPEMVQGLINGSSLSTGRDINAMAAGAVGATAAVAGGIASGGISSIGGMVATGHGAYQLASEQAKESESKDGPSMGARRASMTGFAGQMAKNIGKAGMTNLGQRFRGEMRYGNQGAQMGHEMSQQAERMRTKREGADKPEAPKAASTGTNGRNDNRIYGQDE